MYIKAYFKNIVPNLQYANVSTIRPIYISYQLDSLGVESHLALVSHFLYLLAITDTGPFMARKYPSQRKVRYGQVPGETAKIVVYPNNAKLRKICHFFMAVLMRRQLPPEQSAVKIYRNYTKLIIWTPPIDEKTYFVQTSDTAFLPDIPLYIKYKTPKSLTRELGGWLFFHKFLCYNDPLVKKSLRVQDYRG